MSDVGKWSVVASENNKPSPDGWAENMAPSDVNNSARENMAAIKRMVIGLPYVSTGGVVKYVNETTFTVADDELDQNYAKYFVAGRKINVITATTEYKGSIITSEYASGLTTVTVGLDDDKVSFPADVLDVKVGLQYEDISNATGPNMLGMVLPYTADVESIPFGFGLADGEPFNPNIYKDLAKLYYTGEDESGLPTYKYGTTVVDGNHWPNKPDVRGYFPRFLDSRSAPTGEEEEDTRVDLSAPRSVGSTQEDAVQKFTGEWYSTTNNLTTSGIVSQEALDWTSGGDNNHRMVHFTIDASKQVRTAEETRVKNIAFPGLLVMFGGYASATMITPEDLVSATVVALQPEIDQIKQDINAGISNDIDKINSSVTTAQASATAAQEYAENAAAATVGKQDKFYSVVAQLQATDWTASKETVIEIENLKENDIVWVSPASTETDMETWSTCGVYGKSQAAGSLALGCKTIPTTLTVNIGVSPQ